MTGPAGFWCPVCGAYQSTRTKAEMAKALKHTATHPDMPRKGTA